MAPCTLIGAVLMWCSSTVKGEPFMPILFNEDWFPKKTDGGCTDLSSCAEQCLVNGHSIGSNQTAHGAPSCVGACMMRVRGTSQESVSELCYTTEVLGASSSTCGTGHIGMKAAARTATSVDVDACLAGSVLGTDVFMKRDAMIGGSCEWFIVYKYWTSAGGHRVNFNGGKDKLAACCKDPTCVGLQWTSKQNSQAYKFTVLPSLKGKHVVPLSSFKSRSMPNQWSVFIKGRPPKPSTASLLTTHSFFWNMDAGPTPVGRGFSWYTRMFSIFQEDMKVGYSLHQRMGMGGNWIYPNGGTYDVCPCGPGSGLDGCCKKPGAKCSCAYWLMASVEGGPGYGRFGWGKVPKFGIAQTAGCYQYFAATPLYEHGSRKYWEGIPCSQMGMAQLSNHMVILPDGLTFEKLGFLGVGYVHTPFGKVSPTDKRNFWTVIFDAENFAGPVAYFLPEFWKLRQRQVKRETQHLMDFGNAPSLRQGGFAFEWNTLQNFKDGQGAYKIPNMSVPYKNGRSVFLMNTRYTTNSDKDITVPIENALKRGKLDPSTIMKTGGSRTYQRRHCAQRSNNANYNLEGSSPFIIGRTSTTVEGGECVWSMKVKDTGGATPKCKPNGNCPLPQYIDKSKKVIKETDASEDLRKARFPQFKSSSLTYNYRSSGPDRKCFTSPGPASNTLYCAKTLRGGESSTWIGYKWWKFVDQPALQQAKLTATQKRFMQQRIETMHKVVGRTSRWLTANQAADEGLAHIDGAALTVPPKGMEYGYVPIAIYESYTKPKGCVVVSPTPSPPPDPPRRSSSSASACAKCKPHKNYMVKWGKCSQKSHTCKGRTLQACAVEAKAACKSESCVAFAVRNRPYGSRADFVTYSDGSCVRVNTYRDRYWTLYSEQTTSDELPAMAHSNGDTEGFFKKEQVGAAVLMAAASVAMFLVIVVLLFRRHKASKTANTASYLQLHG